MKSITRKRKESANNFKNLVGESEFSQRIAQTISWGKRSIDSMNQELGRMLVESIFPNPKIEARYSLDSTKSI